MFIYVGWAFWCIWIILSNGQNIFYHHLIVPVLGSSVIRRAYAQKHECTSSKHARDNLWLCNNSLILQDTIWKFKQQRAKTNGRRYFSNQAVQMHQSGGEKSGHQKCNCTVHLQRFWKKRVKILWHVVPGTCAAAPSQRSHWTKTANATACQNP